MKYIYIIIILYSCMGCEKETKCIENYIFEIPIDVRPSRETLKVGDTLVVSMNTDNTNIYDSHNERIVNFPNFDPNAWFLLPMLDTFPVQDGFLENELIIEQNYEIKHISVSTLSSGIFFLSIDTTETVSKLIFKVVLKKPGTYALYSISEMWRNSDNICFPNKCNGCGYATGALEGIFKYTSKINEKILKEKNIAVENDYWKERSGQRRESLPYYFEVVE